MGSGRGSGELQGGSGRGNEEVQGGSGRGSWEGQGSQQDDGKSQVVNCDLSFLTEHACHLVCIRLQGLGAALIALNSAPSCQYHLLCFIPPTCLQTCPLCSSYVPAPETFLHRVDARIKQVWESVGRCGEWCPLLPQPLPNHNERQVQLHLSPVVGAICTTIRLVSFLLLSRVL